jgi:hypothetical protein
MAQVTARILILTASVGESHDLPARLLTDELRDESPGTEVVVADGLRAIGRTFVLVNERAAEVVFFRLRRLWDAAYWLFVHFAPTRRLTQRFVFAIGRGCPTVSYGWRRGHIRANNQASRYGIAEVAASQNELEGALSRALASRHAPDLSFAALPSAASLVLTLIAS